VHVDGCSAARWGDDDVCLAHVEDAALGNALAGVRPGDDVDLRGTSITPALLGRLLLALTPNEEDAHPVLGNARFDSVRFSGDTEFDGVQFDGIVGFDEAQFTGNAGFDEVQFNQGAWFERAQFSGYAKFDAAEFGEDTWFSGAKFAGFAGFDGVDFSGYAGFDGVQFGWYAGFSGTQFSGDVGFGGAQFEGDASFSGAWFEGDAEFRKAKFGGDAEFEGVQFSGSAGFEGARFDGPWFGVMVCQRRFSAPRVVVARSVHLQVATRHLDLTGARFAMPAMFSVRYGTVKLTNIIADAPVTVASHLAPFTSLGMAMDESGFSQVARAKVVSLAGADAANIVLTDVDLSGCVFSGAHHLDQIRLEGRCLFGGAPRGQKWDRALIPVRWWTRRKVLAEEAAWRAGPGHKALALAGWRNPGMGGEPVPAAEPAQLAVLYRQLRKALEDGKDAPGAADFYYGEMEARRHDREGTPRGERALLHAYWLLSGYALRASRALGFLAAAAAVTFLLMMAVGLPDNQLDPRITGAAPAPGQQLVLTQSTPDPVLTVPFRQRFSRTRADQAGLVVVNSVIFRSTGTTLTGPGTWIEIASRIGEPILLGFAAIAARGRVQR
jgi:uncharacterized protein YjbI with pentapeptide repeats